jgi:hypothetical protein
MEYLNMNRKRLIKVAIRTGLVFCVLFTISCGGSTIDSVTTVTPFDKAGHYNLIVERSTKDPSNPLLTEGLLRQTQIGVDVLSVGQDSISLEWTYGLVEISTDHRNQISEQEKKALNFYQGIKFDLVVRGNDEIHIKNYTAIRAKLEVLFLNLYGNDSLTAESEMYARVKRMFEVKAGSSALMLENFFPEIALLFESISEEYDVENNMIKDSVNYYGNEKLEFISNVSITLEEDVITISKFDSIPQYLLREKFFEVYTKMYGAAAAANIPENQIPNETYLVNLNIELNSDLKLRNVVTESQFSNGDQAKINVLGIFIE